MPLTNNEPNQALNSTNSSNINATSTAQMTAVASLNEVVVTSSTTMSSTPNITEDILTEEQSAPFVASFSEEHDYWVSRLNNMVMSGIQAGNLPLIESLTFAKQTHRKENYGLFFKHTQRFMQRIGAIIELDITTAQIDFLNEMVRRNISPLDFMLTTEAEKPCPSGDQG